MSIQIQPQKNFAIVRQLPDPSDSGTYYVRAVIRNAETDTLIDTVNLTDKGNRRFVGVWRAIVDKSGQGTLISIMTAVYSDSGYTTPSTVYGQEMETYLILERFNPNEIVRALGPALGGDGVKVDYKKIGELIDSSIEKKITPALKLLEELEKSDKDEEVIKEIRLMLVSATRDIKESMPKESEPAEKIDFSPVISRLETIQTTIINEIKAKEVTESTDISPIVYLIAQLKNDIEQGDEKSFKNIELIKDTINSFVENEKNIGEVTTQILELKNILSGILVGKNLDSLKNPEPARPDFKKRALEIIDHGK